MSDTFIVKDGYDRRKVKTEYRVRRMTLAEVKALSYGQHVKMLDRAGQLRDVKVNGQPQTWKTRPEDVSVPFKYGYRDTFRMDAKECMESLVIVLDTLTPHNGTWADKIMEHIVTADAAEQPTYTDCQNCGTTDHRWLPCPCECHEQPL